MSVRPKFTSWPPKHEELPLDVQKSIEAGHDLGVIRYVATYVGQDGLRKLMQPCQGRYTYESPEAAQAWLESVYNSPHNSLATLKSVWGENPRCEVRPCNCWPGHFDPKGIYFEFSDADRKANPELAKLLEESGR